LGEFNIAIQVKVLKIKRKAFFFDFYLFFSILDFYIYLGKN